MSFRFSSWNQVDTVVLSEMFDYGENRTCNWLTQGFLFNIEKKYEMDIPGYIGQQQGQNQRVCLNTNPLLWRQPPIPTRYCGGPPTGEIRGHRKGWEACTAWKTFTGSTGKQTPGQGIPGLEPTTILNYNQADFKGWPVEEAASIWSQRRANRSCHRLTNASQVKTSSACWKRRYGLCWI